MLVLGSFAGNVGLICRTFQHLVRVNTTHRRSVCEAYEHMYVSVGLFCGKCRALLREM